MIPQILTQLTEMPKLLDHDTHLLSSHDFTQLWCIDIMCADDMKELLEGINNRSLYNLGYFIGDFHSLTTHHYHSHTLVLYHTLYRRIENRVVVIPAH
jgi:hypothetical protein